jgi:hypothetical protein
MAPYSRRQMILALGGGLGLAGLAPFLDAAPVSTPAGPLFRPRVKRVIQLFMNGGPFGADFFDPKPALNQYAGQRPAEVEIRTERATGTLMPVQFDYARHGQSGLEISGALPMLAQHADDLCVIRSMHTDNPNHGPALYLMNNGTILPTRPSMGSWFSYGLGTENADLPGYVVLCPGRPVRFSELWSSGFLPGQHQGTYINHSNLDPAKMIPFLRNAAYSPEDQRRQLDLMQDLNAEHRAQRPTELALDARIRSLETAYRMQFAATDAFDVNKEPQEVRDLYGKGHFANGCLLARRLSERGVRFVQVYYGNGQPWDTHTKHNATTKALAHDIDQPIAALLTDLKRRGLLDETLILWGGEFGRTATSENGDGRDHNNYGFSVFLAGGGIRGGTAYGATDSFGFRAVENKVHVHDLHATILHLLGINHERLTFRHSGRDYRLTDLAGTVVKDILA